MKPERVAVLLNASAGAIERGDAAALRSRLAAAFKDRGMSATLEVVPRDGLGAAARRTLQQASDGRIDAVIVGGGDGSIHTVAGVLAGSGVALGILPLGTLNHFAKDLRIPTRAEAAIATIAAGMTRAVDLGEVNGEVIINNSSIGVYPYLVILRERERRGARLSKWTAMVLAIPRVLRHLPLFRLTIRLGAQDETIRSPCVFVGNNEYQLALPAVGRRERLAGGELCLYAAKAQGSLALFRLACRCMLGFVDQGRDLRILKGSTAEIQARRHWLLVANDGEVTSMRSPLHYRIRPGALRVFVPAPAPARG